MLKILYSKCMGSRWIFFSKILTQLFTLFVFHMFLKGFFFFLQMYPHSTDFKWYSLTSFPGDYYVIKVCYFDCLEKAPIFYLLSLYFLGTFSVGVFPWILKSAFCFVFAEFLLLQHFILNVLYTNISLFTFT